MLRHAKGMCVLTASTSAAVAVLSMGGTLVPHSWAMPSLVVSGLLGLTYLALRFTDVTWPFRQDVKPSLMSQERAEDMLQTTLDAMEQGIAIYDQNLCFLTCNKSLRRIFIGVEDYLRPGLPIGVIAEQNLQRGWRMIGAPQVQGGELRMILDHCRKAFSDERERQEEAISPEGRIFELRRHPLPNGNMMVSYHDVTEARAYQQALIEAKEEAEFANRTKSQFLANMSHELRTPLNAIIGFSEILRDELYGPLGQDQYKEFAADITESGTHLLSVINDILDLSKIEAGQRELGQAPISLETAVEASCRLIRQRASDGGLSLQIVMPDDLPALIGDEVAMRQILINLLSNAVKFTPHGGSVSVEIRRGDDGTLDISVADTGIGMNEKEIRVALQPFGQVDSNLTKRFEGTGLGLPLVKNLVELQEGQLLIDSERDLGTCVTARFPAHRVQA